ncbi:MAG: methionine--tRNA ligase [Candidatus Zambryskibacteria bacterium RIFCSPLOWO2_02_FULL_51_21]|uniref:Methionine--tRNA ligase n=1 Tax=Candidatus Zambryskibacteria bacterium RIFCSPHIGHO2_02_FULL_43_37 TaxID=1802749 RepID=A0A1G2TGE5_9BACT|nr:MAG: methionine--tRNA ligase [Candidatus Zambryskibacteria bacterium RIFCSPHIGHO2_01_FULL_52_18]OHA96293.1 MAG: methionine--tRNA ligase [Candidatus Zambryskibacteria bacterium RIFCSPHIGHO2_02_FULL_43_37]OHB07513.1 MAG: methionine--tRNA ligase [Candidatus Zambryskibacteria bacterium RIFCSPLOWO2_01_FULL_52_12]OHB11448.1 MAG: methionine--tRNA ligase [Candidatus Zambryskibacteria bacterium RIFCSPLOWO2_02_FULL_51_21]
MSLSNKNFYITTTIPYVNADPHIGFALELVQADIIARAQELWGREVFFTTGTDEHGQKVAEAAKKEGKDTQAYVDEYAEKFKTLKDKLGLHPSIHFVRTTDPVHIEAAQKMWKLCEKDIYKKKYKGLYCVGDEAFVKETDLVDGKCPNHPNMELQEIEEENYFFNLGNYKAKVREYLEKDKRVIPEWRRNEALIALAGMEDVSISREAKRLSWGVPVPGDDEQVMYVWFEALTNYISTLGWPNDPEGNFKKFWEEGETLQVAGKDQVKFQSIIWQAMLFSAGIKNTDTVMYHGFINSGGQKMSKSLGNVIHPDALLAEYGIDAVRYYLLRHISPFDDSDMTAESFHEAYEANLVNGLGNLVSRVLTMADNYDMSTLEPVIHEPVKIPAFEFLKKFEFKRYMDNIWEKIQTTDKKIQEKEPYKVYKTDKEEAIRIVSDLCVDLSIIAYLLKPVMPHTSEVIFDLLRNPPKKPEPLFPRLNA